MIRMKKYISTLVCALLIVSCAPNKIIPNDQSEYSKKDLGLANTYNAYRCRYLRALIGNAGDWYSGFCFMAGNTIYLRMIDTTNPVVGRYLKIPRTDIKSFSVYNRMYGVSELQLRTENYIYGILILDESGGSSSDGTKRYIDQFISWGVPKIETSGTLPS